MIRLVVMAKYPAPGAVKTRLARVLGAETACALSRAFVLDLAERLGRLPYAVTWAYWPPTARFAALVPGARCRPQEGADLGARMSHAVAAALADGPGPILVIGSDTPHVSGASLAEAAAALTAGTDVVLGPAADGGYYLIGLRAPAPALFTDIPWSTARVLSLTCERAARLGLSLHLLPPSFDVDEPADVARLEDALRRGEVALPHTAAVLAARRHDAGTLDSISPPGGHLVSEGPPARPSGGIAMDEWIEEDLSLLADSDKAAATRVLDQRMIREPIRSLDPRRPLALPPAASVREAIRLMREHRVGCLLVVEDDRLTGIITERDLLLKLDETDLNRPVREFMTPDPEVLAPEDPIVYALNKMSVGGFRHVPLVDAAGRPVGIVSVKDIIDYIVGFFPNDVLTVPPDPARGEAWRGRDGG